MPNNQMTVAEFFGAEKITRQHLWDIQDESEYWSKAGLFVLDNWDDTLESLTEKQVNWLNRIQEDMAERRIEGKL